MSTGMQCIGLADERTVQEIETSPNLVQFALDQPMAYEPGKHCEYCFLGMHLLCAILEKTTGILAQEYTRTNLFEPLGIQAGTWPVDPQGIAWKPATCAVPANIAKLGLLWLQWRQVGWRHVVRPVRAAVDNASTSRPVEMVTATVGGSAKPDRAKLQRSAKWRATHHGQPGP